MKGGQVGEMIENEGRLSSGIEEKCGQGNAGK